MGPERLRAVRNALETGIVVPLDSFLQLPVVASGLEAGSRAASVLEDGVAAQAASVLRTGWPVRVPRIDTAAEAAGRSAIVLIGAGIAAACVGAGVAALQVCVCSVRAIAGNAAAAVAASFPCCLCYLACGACGGQRRSKGRISAERRAALLRDGARGRQAMAQERRAAAEREAAHQRRQEVKAACREIRKWAIS